MKKELSKVTESEVPDQSSRTKVRMDGPDGGRAWIVALACCMINFIMAGLGRMSGILYVAFIEEFQVGRRQASTPFTLRSSIRNLLGPIVGILGQKYGVRAVCVAGGALGTISAALCFFATDVTWITILWGGLSGVGSALTVILPQVVIGQYFQKYRTTASGIAFSGGCFGSFIFPLVLEHYILNTGIEGTFLIMAGIIMNTIPAAMILKKPSWLDNEGHQRPSSSDPEKTGQPIVEKVIGKGNVVDSPVTPVSSAGAFRKGIMSRKDQPDVYYLRQNMDIIVKLLTMRSVGENSLTVSLQDCQPVSAIEMCVIEELEDMFRCVQYSGEKVQFYKNLRLGEDFRGLACKNDAKQVYSSPTRGMHTDTRYKYGFSGLFKVNSAPDISKISKDVSNNYVLQKMRDLLAVKCSQVSSRFPEVREQKICRIVKEIRRLYIANDRLTNRHAGLPNQNSTLALIKPDKTNGNGFLDHVKTAFRIHLNPLFLMICFCRCVHFITFMPVMTTVVDFVIDKGLVVADGKYAIAALSVGDLAGRLCLGWITDRGYMSMGKYMVVVMLLQGASTASLPLMHSKVSIFVTLAVFGMLQGSLFVRHPVLVSKYMKSHEQSIAMGCINFFSGILGFGLPFYIGYFRDHLGSYDYIFFLNGIMGALVGLLWLLEPYFAKRLSGKCPARDGFETPV